MKTYFSSIARGCGALALVGMARTSYVHLYKRDWNLGACIVRGATTNEDFESTVLDVRPRYRAEASLREIVGPDTGREVVRPSAHHLVESAIVLVGVNRASSPCSPCSAKTPVRGSAWLWALS